MIRMLITINTNNNSNNNNSNHSNDNNKYINNQRLRGELAPVRWADWRARYR